nr:putative glutathione-dependent formaldehyde-activating enzyme [Quercus suber]
MFCRFREYRLGTRAWEVLAHEYLWKPDCILTVEQQLHRLAKHMGISRSRTGRKRSRSFASMPFSYVGSRGPLESEMLVTLMVLHHLVNSTTVRGVRIYRQPLSISMNDTSRMVSYSINHDSRGTVYNFCFAPPPHSLTKHIFAKMSATSSPAAKKPVKTCSKSSKCLCGAVQFTVSGIDKGTVLCHCSNCQIYGGGAFAYNYRILKADLQIHQGKEQLKSYRDEDTKTGGVLLRHFCSNCGSSLFAKPLAIEGMVVLCTGGAQDKTCPSLELFAENKLDWVGDLVKAKPKM